MFDKIREKLAGKDSTNQDSSSNNESTNQSATYKCPFCGKTISGPCLYCDGCSQYMDYDCAIPSGYMTWNCPNCAIETKRVVL